MANLIDRQATYDTLTDYYHHTTDIQHTALRDALSKVPSAQQWTPVTERLPDNYTSVLVAVDSNGITEYEIVWYIGGTWQCLHGLNGEVKAWMPIPRYEGE